MMKLSHLLADDIRAQREIEIVSRRRQDDVGRASTQSASWALWTSTILHRRLLPAR